MEPRLVIASETAVIFGHPASIQEHIGPMDRRHFLRSACQACAALALVPAAATLESCSSSKGLALAVKDGVLEVPVSALDPSGRTTVKAKGVSEKLMVVRRDDGTYTALTLNCPHKNGPVTYKDGEGLKCGWHGSRFDLEGKVQNGPSKQDLKRFPAEVKGDQLRILLM
jgi:nitrite reductase/ring-hydroxylating ferredoxin subunit